MQRHSHNYVMPRQPFPDKSFSEIPITDKRTRFAGTSIDDLLIVDPRNLRAVLFSSGRSGGALSWTALTAANLAAADQRLRSSLSTLWKIPSQRTILLINALPAGVSLTIPGVLAVPCHVDSERSEAFVSRWPRVLVNGVRGLSVVSVKREPRS